jgi:hypothetical protein
MIDTLIAAIVTALVTLSPTPFASKAKTQVLASKAFSLDNRYAVKSVNEVMKKNILLNVAYLEGTVKAKQDVNWDQLEGASHSEFTLKPKQTFAFHNIVLPEYKDSLALTQGSSFSSTDGYLSDGYLFGDGVCHLASLINWAAQEAGLITYVPKDHRSVAHIPDIPDDFGVSIYKDASRNIGANNNLYITNNKDRAVVFSLDYANGELKVTVSEVS